MKDDKLCVLLSHFHVRTHELFKFDVVKYVINHYKKQNCFVILVGHGEMPLPKDIKEMIDDHYWEEKIDHSEIGRGHPKLCIKGYEIAMSHRFSKILKTRAEDLILKEDVKSFLDSTLGDKRLLISEQTSLQRNMIGDLFHYGELMFMYNLWNSLPWNYQTDGLRNLFYNTMNYYQSDMSHIKENFSFIGVKPLQWVCVTDSWNYLTSEPKNLKNCYWGLNRYNYWGGL